MTKAFAYLRVSGDSQVDRDGFPRQLAEMKAYAATHDIKIVRVFEEKGVSGETEWENRPAWAEMIASLNGVQTILVEQLNRLARELFIQEYILRDLNKRAVTLIPVRDPDINSSPERIMFRQIMGSISQYEKTMIVHKLRAARTRMKAATGRCEGRKPFGHYPAEVPILAQIRALRDSGLGYDRIAQSLNCDGVKPRLGGKWHGATVNRILRKGGINDRIQNTATVQRGP